MKVSIKVLISSITFLVGFISINLLKAQEIEGLNNFKYVVVETLIDPDMTVDKYLISARVRKSFIDKGFTVVNENKQSWPSELFNDPCLGLYCNIEPRAGMMTKYRVDLLLSDCNQEEVYSFRGKGNGATSKEAFQNATEEALDELEPYEYRYMAREPIKKKSTVATYSSPLVGWFESTGMKDQVTLAIVATEDSFEARVHSSGSKRYKEGRMIGRFTESTIAENIYNVEWMGDEGQSFKTLAKLEEGFRLVIELDQAGEEKVLVFRKVQ